MYVVIYFFPCCLWIFAGLVKALGSAEKREERSGFQKPSDAITSMYPVLRTLTRRQLEVLHLKGIPLPDSEFRVVDLSQNLSFASVTAGKVPCVTPAGEKFLTKECRFITGIESLRLQGIWYDEEKLGRYSSPFLQDLAGNAFETSSCSANFLCSVIFLAVNSMCEKVQTTSFAAGTPTLELEDEPDADLGSDSDGATSVSPHPFQSLADKMFHQICEL